MTSRRQATLYLSLPDSTAIESLRARFNRAQFELIRAHVTLYAPSMSTDGLTLFWFRPKRANVLDGDLWTASRATKNEPFSGSHSLGSQINTDASEQHPFVSADGLVLFFDRGTPDSRLWQSRRKTTDDAFTSATLVPLPESWQQRCAYAPSLTSDGKLLVFSSNVVPGKEGFETGELWITKLAKRRSNSVAIETQPARGVALTAK